MDTVEEMISFLAVETGGVDLVVLVVVMLDGAGMNVAYMTAIAIWMDVDVAAAGGGLIIEEMLQIGVEAEVTVLALKRFVHGVIAEAVAVAEVEAGAGAEAGPAAVAAVLDGVTAVAAVPEAAAALDVAAVVVEAKVMTDMRGHMTDILIRRTLHSLKPRFLLNQRCLPCHQALRHFHHRNFQEVTLTHIPQ